MSVWKDYEYLKWRYEKHPHNRYLFHLLNIKGKTDCVIVTKVDNNEVHICEILSRTKNLRQTLILLNYVTLYSHKINAQKIDYSGHDNGFFNSLFKKAGFNDEISSFVFCGKTFQENEFKNIFIMPNNWTITVGDTDVI